MASGYEINSNRGRRRPPISKEEYLRRKKALRRRQITRYVVFFGVLTVVLALIIYLAVIGIKALFGLGEDKTSAETVSIESIAPLNELADYEGSYVNHNEISLVGDDNSTDLVEIDGMSQSGEDVTVNGPVIVNGVELFGGYSITKSDSIKYIDSENVQSTYALIIDGLTGEAIASKEGFTRINPASMTKILTVLVAAEKIDSTSLDTPVTILPDNNYYAYKHGLSAVGFSDNEVVTLKDLFYGTILPSGADAAAALADYVAGSEENFVELMNQKIAELGLTNTHFTNCVGSYNENHYSTCADMAVILKAAIENPICYEALNAHRYTTTKTTEHPEGIEISNWFLRRIEDKDTNGEVLCAKTGYVNQSGSCAASYSLDNLGHPYIVVTADAHSAWRCIYDHVDIYKTYTGK